MQLRFAVGSAVVLATVASADTLMLQERGLDHPDGNASPPPYGLRLDGLFEKPADVGGFAGGVGGVAKDTSFSFESNGSSVIVKVFEVNTADIDQTNDYRVEISGTVYGGQDDGDDANPDFGAGFYNIFMSFSFNVQAVTDGWEVNPNSASNSGWIESVGNADVPAGNKWFFYDKTDNNNNSFLLRADNHRNPGVPHHMVGRGWLTLNSDGSMYGNSGSTQDWLFITSIPLPSGAGLALAGLGILGIRRCR